MPEMTPADALALIADLDAALDDVVALHEADDPGAGDAAEALIEAIEAARFDTLGDDLDDDGWHEVDAALQAFFDRLADLAGAPRETDPGDDSTVAAATSADSAADTKRRRFDPATIILDGFYGGLYHAGRAAWWSVRTAVTLSIAAGRLAAPYVAAGARAAGRAIADGVVAVAAYVRSDGTEVPAHERSAPGKSTHPHTGAAMLTRALQFKASGFDDATGEFEGYGSVFGVLDDGGDIVERGAFAMSLADHKAAGTMPALLMWHDPSQPVGVWLQMSEDEHGLRCKGRLLLDIERGREAYALLKSGAVSGLSIGFECQEWSHVDADVAETKYGWYGGASGSSARLLTKCDLWEVSIVTFPMCRPSRVDAVKQFAARRDPGLDDLAAALARRGAALAA